MQKVRINQGRIVPWQFRLVGTGFVFISIAASMARLEELYAISISIFMSFLMPPLWSSYYVIEIDPENKTISDLYWIVGLKSGKTITYHQIEKIFINPVNVSQRITSYAGKATEFNAKEFTAYLKLDDGKTFELLSNKSAEDLIKAIEPIAKKLECNVTKNFDT